MLKTVFRTHCARALALPAGAVALACLFFGCSNSSKNPGAGEVLLYCSLDDIFARPIVEEFEKRTGIKVRCQYDAEAAKTVGLVNRLIARKEHPDCDVFWNNELGQTLVLKEKGVLEPYKPKAAEGIPERFRDPEGGWTGFAARARVILYNTQSVKPEDAPKTLEDLAHSRFKGRAVIARPLFGTTYTHAAALFSKLGDEKARAWFRALQANEVAVTYGNGPAARLVGDGEKAVCLTDTDDANGMMLRGKPVAMVYPDADGAGTLLIPNTLSLIKGGPNPENGKKLIEFLLSAEVEALLAKGESAQIPVRPGVPPGGERFKLESIKALDVDWADVARRFPAVKEFVEADLKW